MNRTDYCGSLREQDIDRQVTVCGWAQTKRDMGGIVFIDLRDKKGVLQVVFDARNLTTEEFAMADRLKTESVIEVSGVMRKRDEETINPKIETGTIELAANHITVLSEADTLPFTIDDNVNVKESLRLKYRFLDLRRPNMLKNLQFRAKLVSIIRRYLENKEFLEVETPTLTKSTPEGARDYLVPSRVHQGSFYALPQSPQIFKQLLMVAGIDKYYQVARCFRDEDLRADRQPEFTQVDMEMSFVNQEDILVFLEDLFKNVFEEAMGQKVDYTFPRLTWTEAMDTYGSDKPDLRFGLPIVDLTDLLTDCHFSVFSNAIKNGGVVRAINAKGCGNFTRGTIDILTQKAISYGAKGMAWIAIREDGTPHTILDKYFSEEEFKALLDRMETEPGDFILFSADKLSVVRKTLGALRLDLGDMLNLRDPNVYQFEIITDFPEFEWSEEENRYMSTHHPFTMPYEEDIPYLKTDQARVRAQAYDVVLNGVELGSGSIRIHNRDVQEQMFEALGFTKEQIEERFGFMVGAFRYGTPPHGGFAFGLDRLAMLLLGAESLREVIAFPKNKEAVCPMTDAPDAVDKEQLEVLGLLNLGEGTEGGTVGTGTASALKIDVDNVANLAQLKIEGSRKETMAKDMAEIVAFANQLASIDTTGVPPMAHIVPLKNVFREDEVTNTCDKENLLSNAPEQADGCYFVPQVVE